MLMLRQRRHVVGNDRALRAIGLVARRTGRQAAPRALLEAACTRPSLRIPRGSRRRWDALAAGMSIFQLARVMGASVKTIDKHYGHLAHDSEDAIYGLLNARSRCSGVDVASGPAEERPLKRPEPPDRCGGFPSSGARGARTPRPPACHALTGRGA